MKRVSALLTRIEQFIERVITWCSANFENDLDKAKLTRVREKVVDQTKFSLSYGSLLISSTIICTLGLLLNSTPVVIGGMLISPLMWPILGISLAIVENSAPRLKRAVLLLFISIAVATFSAVVIVWLSPVKSLNGEITSRTNPTLLDLFVAMAGGIIATISLFKQKISESLAGVAIATALLPPLCVGGIGIALRNYSIAFGALGLFGANIIAILFVSMLIYFIANFTHKRRNEKSLQRKSVIIVTTLLIIVTLPLAYSLKEFAAKSATYARSQDILESSLREIIPSVIIEDVEVVLRRRNFFDQFIDIRATIIVPEDRVLTYENQQTVIDALRQKLEREIDLNLIIQKSIAIVSEENTLTANRQQTISSILVEKLSDRDDSLQLDSLTINEDQQDNSLIYVVAVVRTNPNTNLSKADQLEIENALSDALGNETVRLQLDVIPRLTLRSDFETELSSSEQILRTYFSNNYPRVDISEVAFNKIEGNDDNGKQKLAITTNLVAPEGFVLNTDAMQALKTSIEVNTDMSITMTFNITDKRQITL